jgi:hypothetical protein
MKNKCVCQWAAIDTKKFLISSMHDRMLYNFNIEYLYSIQSINTENERRLISISTEQILITYTALMEFSSAFTFSILIYNIYEFKLKIIACVI